MATNLKVHTFEEVSKHNNKKDCWNIISGKVYDLTSFLDDHPGGDEALIAATAKDATEDFEDAGHSKAAIEMMEKYLIGEIDVTTLPWKKKTKLYTEEATSTGKESSTDFIKILMFLVPILMLALAIVSQQYGTKNN